MTIHPFIRTTRTLRMIVAMLSIVTSCALGATEPLSSSDYNDEGKLAELLWERTPDIIEARERVGVAGSELTRSQLYPNPQLDAGWNTIPIGRSNPPDLVDPIGNVPNYT